MKKSLVFTSLCFFIPAAKGFMNGLKLLPFMNACTAIASVNHWRDPVMWDKKNITDVIIANSNFLLHQYYLHKYFCAEFVILDLAVMTAFLKSQQRKKHWGKWHMLFHMLTITATTRLLHCHTPQAHQKEHP